MHVAEDDGFVTGKLTGQVVTSVRDPFPGPSDGLS